MESLTPYERFQPRPNRPEQFDEQSAFVNSKAKFAIVCGGNRSGKTICAAYKTAKYVLETPPFRIDCPFWILGWTFDLACQICWKENLRQFIPPEAILDIAWEDKKRGLPRAVMLRHPQYPEKIGWNIEFRSYDQGVLLQQGRSIGGYWFNEEAPIEVVSEVQVRCSNYDAPGWADFTPIHLRDPRWVELYEEPPEGWQFYRMNVWMNKTLKIQEWARTFIPTVAEDERETRETGAFGNFFGQVFKEFQRRVHIIDPVKTENDRLRAIAETLDRHELPPNWRVIRGIDFGYSNPFACIWVAVDRDKNYYVFDEHHEAQRLMSYHYARIIERPWNYNDIRYGPTFCDTEDPQLIQELINLGLKNATGANKASGSVSRSVSMVRRLMVVRPNGKPRLYILSKCEKLIREIMKYHYPPPIGKDLRMRNPIDEPVDMDNHSIDAMRYAIYTDAVGKGAAPRAVRRELEEREGVQFKRGR